MSRLFLVTGGAGFIGSHIVDKLLETGHKVRVLDNFSTGDRGNLAQALDDIELVEGDIRSYERVHNAMKGVDYVIHLAALGSVPRSVRDPLTTNAVNITGTLNVLLAARDENVKQLVFASSSSVYGANDALPKQEALQTMPISPYAVSKLAGEKYCMASYHVYGLQAGALRYFNIFGPRQDPTSQYSAVIPRFLDQMSKGEQPVIYGDGKQSRDFTYVANAVDATIAAATMPGIAGSFVNIACGGSHTLLGLIDVIGRSLGKRAVPVFEPERPGDVKHSYADIAEAKRILGYEPKVSLEEGIKLMVEQKQA